MIKALRRIFMQDRERINIPRSVQQTIPYQTNMAGRRLDGGQQVFQVLAVF